MGFIGSHFRRGFGSRLHLFTGVVIPPEETYSKPTKPTALIGTGGHNLVNLSWTGSTATDSLVVLGYRIFGQDGSLIAETPNTYFTIVGLADNTHYIYRVASYTAAPGAAGQSDLSDPVDVVTVGLPPDTVPDAFSFTAKTGLPVSGVATSDPITIMGLTAPTSVFIDTAVYQDSQWSFDGVTWNSPTTITNGQALYVRHSSPDEFSTSKTTAIVIGGVTGTFTSTTEAQDTFPAIFSFANKAGQTLGATVTSDPATITGINSAAAVTVTNGTVQINGTGGYVSSGTITSGQTITARHTASGSPSTSVTTVVNVGGRLVGFTSTTGAADTIPDAFSFAAQTGVTVSTPTTSAPAIISGITGTATVTVSGGTWRKNGTGSFSSSSGTVVAGNTVEVQHTSSGSFGTQTSTTLTVGGVQATFTSTTEAADSFPNSFSFTAQTGVPLNAVCTSDDITVAGINTAATITVSNGSYSIDGGAFVTTSGTVNNGQSVTARQTASASPSTSTSCVIVIGGMARPFNVTTAADTTAPSAPVLNSVTNVGLDGLQLDFSASTDNVGVVAYYIYVDGAANPSGFTTLLTYTFTNYAPAVTHSYRVAAVDAAGNISALSNAISGTTPPDVANNRTLGMSASLLVQSAGIIANQPVVIPGNVNITGVNTANYAHGDTLIIDGTNFGTKTTVAPFVWDDASGASMSSKWDTIAPSTGDTNAYFTRYITPAALGRGMALPHNNITKYIAGAHAGRSSGAATDATSGYNVEFAKNLTISSFPMSMYISYYKNIDPAWSFGGDDNLKELIWNRGWGWLANLPWNVYVAYNTTLHNKTTTSDIKYVFGVDANAANSAYGIDFNQRYQSGTLNPWQAGWTKIEYEIVWTNQTSGTWKMWQSAETGAVITDRNFNRVINYTGKTDNFPDSGSLPVQRAIGIGGYARNYPDSTNWRYWADVYIDTSFARVMLGNNPTYANCTIREPQKLSETGAAWSATQITCKVNKGRLSNGSAWLFVIDSAGNVNPSGFQVQLV